MWSGVELAGAESSLEVLDCRCGVEPAGAESSLEVLN